MNKFLFFTFMAFAVFDAHADLSGNFEKTSGPDDCSAGHLQIKTNQKLKERIVLLGSQLSWTLTLENKGQTKENSEGGCTYLMNYELSQDTNKDLLLVKTERSRCPLSAENGTILESLELIKDNLKYKYEFISSEKKKTAYSCHFKRKT